MVHPDSLDSRDNRAAATSTTPITVTHAPPSPNFFGTSNPFESFFGGVGSGGSGGHGVEGMDIDLETLLGGGMGSRVGHGGPGPFRSQTFSHGQHGGKEQRMQDPTIVKEVPVSLEDICKGVDKKMKISRKVYDTNGHARNEEKVVTLSIKPGWKAGTKVTFSREGDQVPGKIPADVAFVIKDKPHAKFTRDGAHIVHTKKISLREALCGTVIEVPTLEGKTINVNCTNQVIKPQTTKTLQGYGLPYPKEPGRKGDLVVKFDILFPDRLSQSSKDILFDVLS